MAISDGGGGLHNKLGQGLNLIFFKLSIKAYGRNRVDPSKKLTLTEFRYKRAVAYLAGGGSPRAIQFWGRHFESINNILLLINIV